MGRRYHYPKRKYRHGGKASLIAALLSAVVGRGRHYPPPHYDAYGYPPPYRRRSLKHSILSALLKRMLRKFL